MNNSCLVWAEPMERAKPASLLPSDISKALGWFKQSSGQDAKGIVLHPKYKGKVAIPEGLTVDYVSGCLAWEIWLSSDCNPQPARYDTKKPVEPQGKPAQAVVAVARAVTLENSRIQGFFCVLFLAERLNDVSKEFSPFLLRP